MVLIGDSQDHLINQKYNVDTTARDPMAHQSKRVVVDVDPRGRVSLGRFAFKSTQVVVDQLEGGGLSFMKRWH